MQCPPRFFDLNKMIIIQRTPKIVNAPMLYTTWTYQIWWPFSVYMVIWIILNCLNGLKYNRICQWLTVAHSGYTLNNYKPNVYNNFKYYIYFRKSKIRLSYLNSLIFWEFKKHIVCSLIFWEFPFAVSEVKILIILMYVC